MYRNGTLRTINGYIFLIKDVSFNHELILEFTTKSNVEHLKKSTYWIMDGTFKTVPTLFRKLYTIHVMAGTAEM